MIMSPEQTLEIIPLDALLDKVRALKEQYWRLVQISATRLPEQFELTYSFDLQLRLANLRVLVPAAEPRLPSISSIYWCAFLYENEMHDLFGLQVEGINVDFKGNFYKTAVKYAFGRTKAPAPKPAPAAAPATAPALAQPSTVH